jgi:hypothetical protein
MEPKTQLAPPTRRERITGEPDRTGQWSPDFPDVDWIGFQNMGPTKVREDFEWSSNPKQWQEEYGTGSRNP